MFQKGFPISLSSSSTPLQVKVYRFRQSLVWHNIVQPLSLFLLFLSSFFELSKNHPNHTNYLSFIACVLIAADLFMNQIYNHNKSTDHALYITSFFILAHIVELSVTRGNPATHDLVYSSIFKPVVLFYLVPTAIPSLTSFLQILPVTVKINSLYLGFVFVFSLLAYHLYATLDEHFRTHFHSFVTLFALSTR